MFGFWPENKLSAWLRRLNDIQHEMSSDGCVNRNLYKITTSVKFMVVSFESWIENLASQEPTHPIHQSINQ